MQYDAPIAKAVRQRSARADDIVLQNEYKPFREQDILGAIDAALLTE